MRNHTTQADKRTATAGETNLSIDRIHKILSNSRRRAVLDVLRERGPMDKSEVVDAVTAVETDTPPERVCGTERKRVHVSLHQCHLPKLEEAGVVVKEDRKLTLGPNATEVHGFRHDTRSGGTIGRIKQVLCA